MYGAKPLVSALLAYAECELANTFMLVELTLPRVPSPWGLCVHSYLAGDYGIFAWTDGGFLLITFCASS